uniref:Methyltransferase type 11 domain-containing protein n=1 Tax=Calcidiscus leptoporus TaxID=127549 RepID=A0A7S0P3E4_9EUKA
MWQSGASAYEASFALVTKQAANALLDAAGMHLTRAMAISIVEKKPLESRQGGGKLLDVATGTGVIAAQAAARGAEEVVALDFSTAMLSQAQPVADAHPCVTLMEGDAMALPLPDASFDSVVIGFGLLHLPHPDLALKEAHRVLKPGGKLSFSVWQSPEHSAGMRILQDAIARHGNPGVSLPDVDGAPPLPFFHFACQANAIAALVRAGFGQAACSYEEVPIAAALRDEHELFGMFRTATARTRALLELQSAQQLAAIEEAIAHELRENFKGAWYQGVSRQSGGTKPGCDAYMSDITTGKGPIVSFDGRRSIMVPMPAVVAAATKS